MRMILLAVLLLGVPRIAHAQDAQLRRVVDAVADAWARGDARGIVAHLARDGVALELDEGRMGPIAPRQAAALLRRLFEDVETVSLRALATELIGGAPPRAFGELAWTRRAEGTSMPVRVRVFIGLVQDQGSWKVSQIRLLE